MFGLFKKKTEAEKLNRKYDKLMQEGYELSTTNRKTSDAKYAEAGQIMKEIEKLEQQEFKTSPADFSSAGEPSDQPPSPAGMTLPLNK